MSSELNPATGGQLSPVEQQLVLFGAQHLLTEQVMGYMNKQPGYRMARGMAEELVGPMDTWNLDDIYGVPVHRTTAGSTQRSISSLPFNPQEAVPAQDALESTKLYTPSDNDKILLISQLAPHGNRRRIYGILQSIAAPALKHSESKAGRLYKGARVVDYLRALSCLHLFGPDGANVGMVDDQDDYPVWYGHWNQVLGEVTDAVKKFVPKPASHQLASHLNGFAIKGYAWNKDPLTRESYKPYSEEVVRATYLVKVPWYSPNDQKDPPRQARMSRWSRS